MYLSEFGDVCYLKDLNVVFVKWKKFFRSDDYRNPLLCALEIMGNHKDCHFVADTRNGFENEPENTKWCLKYFCLKLQKQAVKKYFSS